MELESLTDNLLTYMDTISNKFLEVKESKVKGDFFTEVKPFADEVKEVNDEWKEKAIDWIKRNKPRKLYPSQIESTYEQIELLSIQAFYPDTSRTRFLNYLQSVRFILKSLQEVIEEKEK